jgi:hypothetical protein
MTTDDLERLIEERQYPRNRDDRRKPDALVGDIIELVN